MSRKTAADVHLELAVHEKECSERWKTAFGKFEEIETDVKESTRLKPEYNFFASSRQQIETPALPIFP